MRRCLLVPDKVRSVWDYRAEIRRYMEQHVFPKSEVTRVYITPDEKRCLVSAIQLEPIGTERHGYPEFEKHIVNLTFELEKSPFGAYMEVSA